MTTLSVMKARIATEIRRPLTSDIASAITTAIEAYQEETFFFNEFRMEFAAVASQEFYDEDDDADIGNLTRLDYMKLVYGDQIFDVKEKDPSVMEMLSQNATNVSQPLYYCRYAQSIRLYPVPDQVYTIRLGGEKIVAAPASDGETDNPWMTHAERLIRARAKWELAIHRTYDDKMATRMSAVIEEAMAELRRKTNKRATREGQEVVPTQF